MRAAVFHGAGDIRVEHVPDPSCGPRDVVVAVESCGVCGSDLHAYRDGRYVAPKQVMGHEIAGTVVEVGAATCGIAPGIRVAVMPYVACGSCGACARGRAHLCATWATRSIAYGLPGGFAEAVRVPDAELGNNVHAIPDGVASDAAALCEPLAVAVHAVAQSGVGPGDEVMVVGVGPIGLLMIVALRAAGVREIVAVDVAPRRLASALAMGASSAVAAEGRPLRRVQGDATAEVDVVFECAGAPALIDQGLRALRSGGVAVAVALYGERSELTPTLLVQRELRLQGSFGATPRDFREARGLLERGAVDVERLVTHRFGLDGIGEAFEVAVAGDALKVMVRPGDRSTWRNSSPLPTSARVERSGPGEREHEGAGP